jgi:hypothetical protein
MVTASLPSLASWHHICGVWALGSLPDLYVDGASVAIVPIAGSGGPSSDGGGIDVARLPVISGPTLNGKLSDLSLFDRVLTSNEIQTLARGALRAGHIDPVWHVTLEGGAGAVTVGDVGVMDMTGCGNHIDVITNAPMYWRDPPLHWPAELDVVPAVGRVTHNSRPTMNVVPGTKLATMRGVV